ncbi:fluoride efflux transporter CrcB [Aquibacillus salsiterrae]|uniref:Fluoride-specific ion channel FluC n=1 Tax=Aquibacillus salsiterrae TaxID=2950439 RepID=A0A9X3WHN3_9BACI|nr:fluoride efflux transporter CrcB [Aquibacillus salsiterrae]MDC3417629.1 fluoride efflux transporter CrcB [Aquibacillus salsiterrae]
MFFNIVLVGIGGFCGAVSRFIISKAWNHAAFPYGTFTVNILGAFLLGLVTGLQANEKIALLVGTGFFGAFTTFSTFKLETVKFALFKQKGKAIYYLVATYGLGIILAYIGYVIGA